MKKLELCIGHLSDLELARQYDIAQIELCAGLELGGLTPDFDFVGMCRENFKGEIAVLIRPRPGNFHYNQEEKKLMLIQVKTIISLNIDCLVVAALNDQSELDLDFMRRLIDESLGTRICFHKAIDSVAEPFKALDELLSLQVDRVLSAGGKKRAVDGLEQLLAFQEYCGDKIEIIAGGKIRSNDLEQMIKNSTIKTFHSSLSMENPVEDKHYGTYLKVDEKELLKCTRIINRFNDTN
ncbi:MAG: hypothetical protein IPM48_01340 [Saprospiraceae bacterium]|nr:hypothetical protein [Saprospiraceae bacterium]